jgi:hypothetical protein
MRMRRGILVVAFALTAASCSGFDEHNRTRNLPSSTTRTPPSAAKPGMYAVGELTETFVDTSRGTESANGQGNARHAPLSR